MSTDESSTFIPPWKQESLLRRLWRGLVQMRQWLLLALLAAVAWGLWQQVQQSSRFPAHALLQTYTVGAPVAGLLVQVKVEKGARVQKGDVLAQIDDRPLRLEWEMAKLEKKRLAEQLVSDAIQFRLSLATLQTRLQAFVHGAQTSWAENRTRWRSSRAELSALNKEMKWLQQARSQRLGRPNNLGTLQARQRSLQALVKEMPRLLRLYRTRRRQAQRLHRRMRRFSGKALKSQIEKILRPLQLQWAIQTLRIKTIQIMRERLTLRAPVTGVVQMVLQRPGITLAQGAPVLQLVQDNQGMIQAYVGESLARRVRVGMSVQAMLRFPSQERVTGWLKKGQVLCAKITGLGAMEPIPMRFRSIPRQPVWVRPVTIQLDTPASLVPGEMMFVEFSAGGCKR